MFKAARWFPQAFAFAVVVNVLLFAGVVLLAGEIKSEKQDITAPTGVNLMNMAPEPPPAEEQAKEPEPPKREEAKPDLA